MKPIVMLVVVVGFFLTACGNNTNVNPPYLPEPPSKPALQYLTELSGQGDIFSAAVLQTEILDELEPNTVVTMFTPSVAWFAQEGITKEAFLAQPQLEEIVAYHVLTSRLGNLAIPSEPDTQLPTLQGQSISLTKAGERYLLNDRVQLLTPPIAFRVTNEVDILQVDQLLLPQNITFE